MQDIISLEIQIDPSQQGEYLIIPFTVPDGVETLTLKYSYERRLADQIDLENGQFISSPEVNVIDLGLIYPNGKQAGASGSDKREIYIRESEATPGYRPSTIYPGQWQIIVGAYKVDPEGVKVRYEVILDHKEPRLLRGDLHTHTIASDGVHSLEELAWKAKRNRLDFVAVTDHNQMISADALPRIPGVTMIPGIEWTHFQGHANFIGVDCPYDEPFLANTIEEMQSRFNSARERGALITINHPFEEICPFQFDYNQLPFDCIEVWNGPMREANLKAVGLWQQLLSTGKKVPISGGSDYHRDTPFIFLGGPTMGVFSMSAGPSDILEAIRRGHAFITFAPNGPTLDMTAGETIMGGSVKWDEVKQVHIHAFGLLAGDVLRVITGSSADVIFQMKTDGDVSLVNPMAAPGFARVEILRAFLPGLPMLPALISNPIYFDG